MKPVLLYGCCEGLLVSAAFLLGNPQTPRNERQGLKSPSVAYQRDGTPHLFLALGMARLLVCCFFCVTNQPPPPLPFALIAALICSAALHFGPSAMTCMGYQCVTFMQTVC